MDRLSLIFWLSIVWLIVVVLSAILFTVFAMQRGYLMGLARTQAQREMNNMVDEFEGVLAEIHAEMRGVRDELARLRTLDDAILAERDPTMWLN